MPSVTGTGESAPVSPCLPTRARPDAAPDAPLEAAAAASAAVHRSPIEGIEARARGHTLAGFVRRCNPTGYGFFARRQTCRIEVAVHRGDTGWDHTTRLPRCAGGGPGDAQPTSRTGV